MQRLTCVAYTFDSRYILSGSDEMNLRLWKAIAWQKQGVVSVSLVTSNKNLRLPLKISDQTKRASGH